MTAEHLKRLAGPEFAPLWSAARRRLEGGGLALGTTPVSLTELTPGERDAISGLIGQRWAPGGTLKVDLVKLDAQLRRVGGAGVAETVESIGGPLVDRRAQRASAVSTRTHGWHHARQHRALQLHPVLGTWLDRLQRGGRLTRLGLDNPFDVLQQALDVAVCLPTDPVALAVLAVRVTGDAHGLDRSTPLGVLTTEAVQAITGQSGRRDAWRAAGVELDSVSSSALTFGMRGHPVMDTACDIGEPVRITWRMLQRFTPCPSNRVVWVCENPVVVDAAALQLGIHCGPVVCTDGMPIGVVWQLLGQLRDAGAELRVHADFDIGGLRIAGAVIARTGALPWRFDSASYEHALTKPSTPVVGQPPPTPWDPSLQAAVAEHRRAVHEEALLDDLLGDLTT